MLSSHGNATRPKVSQLLLNGPSIPKSVSYQARGLLVCNFGIWFMSNGLTGQTDKGGIFQNLAEYEYYNKNQQVTIDNIITVSQPKVFP